MKYSITVEGSGPFTYNVSKKTLHAPEGPTSQDWRDLWEGLDAWWLSSPSDRMDVIAIIRTVLWGVGAPSPPDCRSVYCTNAEHYYLNLDTIDIISVDNYHSESLHINPLIMSVVKVGIERRYSSVNYLCVFKVKSLLAGTLNHTATLIHHENAWTAWAAPDADGLVTNAIQLEFLDGTPSDDETHRGMQELRDICATGSSIVHWTKETFHD